MNAINVVTIGKLIAAHREGDEEKFKNYVDFIADAYEQQGKSIRPEARGDRCGVHSQYRKMGEKVNHKLIDQNHKSGIM